MTISTVILEVGMCFKMIVSFATIVDNELTFYVNMLGVCTHNCILCNCKPTQVINFNDNIENVEELRKGTRKFLRPKVLLLQ